MTYLTDSFDDVQNAINVGKFDPQGLNATTFSQPIFPAATGSQASLQPNSNDDIISDIMGNMGGLPKTTATENKKPWLDLGITDPDWLKPFGKMLGGSSPQEAIKNGGGNSADWSQYFVRGIVVILGFIFVAVGLTLLGAQTKIGNSVLTEVKKAIPK